MAQNFYLKIGDITGEVAKTAYADQIEALSWSHSFNQPTSPTRTSAGGGTVEMANHADFSFTKYLDAASIALLKACWSGQTIATATFTACRSDGDTPIPYLTIEMTDVIVSNVSFGGGSGDIATETITLSYSKITYTYQQQKDAGGNSGKKVTSCDRATGTVS